VAWLGYRTAAEGLVLAGRVDEAPEMLSDDRTLPAMSSLEGMSRGLLRGICLILTGRPAEDRGFAESALASAASVRARPAEQAATAVLAEIEARTGDVDGAAAQLLAEVGETSPDSVVGLLALRARAALGHPDALQELRKACENLRAPGLSRD